MTEAVSANAPKKSAKKDKKLTPLMAQYWEIKNQHLDKILFFRMGDFFEMFHDDARLAAPILEIALTQRNKKSEDDTAMCGMPHHSIAGALNKLLSAGHKVAICDQVEDPKDAKGIVKREVVRILSPGMVYDPETLDELSANYLCSFDKSSISFLDSTTGEAFYYLLSDEKEKQTLLQSMSPKEIVVSSEQLSSAKEKMPLLYYSSFDEFESYTPEWPESANKLLHYAVSMQGEPLLQLVKNFEKRQLIGKMEISPIVHRHLEVFENYRGEKEGSLFESIRRTKTSVGARLLKQWLRFPLIDQGEIEKRLSEVKFWHSDMALTKKVRSLLGQIGDIERRLGKISHPQCHPRDLLALSQSLNSGLSAMSCIAERVPSDLKSSIERSIAVCKNVEKTLHEEPPAQLKKGGFIRKGFRSDLDELIELSTDTQKALNHLEAKEKESTGIPSLKIRYNNVFGYYIEVTNTHKDKVPEHYIRKQTLTNAERYVTEELGQLEAKVLSARTRRIELEMEVFQTLKKDVLSHSEALLEMAGYWSEIDVYSSLAWLALEENYSEPKFQDSNDLELVASRHPVVEQKLNSKFIPNDINMDANHCFLLTGPNMAGKSTVMRQVAIVSIMAQIGSFVPAEKAKLPIFNKMFTRIGASDFLTEGLSTFMVEMTETAQMLNSADEKSLVILDEIGRGTSTYDGMSLAQAILENLVTESRAMTLFATHYHELTSLADKYPQIRNVHMKIREKAGKIDFLHTLSMGPANKSYGIQVAKLAGLPESVVRHAGAILRDLENKASTVDAVDTSQMSLLSFAQSEEKIRQAQDELVEKFSEEEEKLIDELKSFMVNDVTPLEALNKISQWQRSLS